MNILTQIFDELISDSFVYTALDIAFYVLSGQPSSNIVTKKLHNISNEKLFVTYVLKHCYNHSVMICNYQYKHNINYIEGGHFSK